MLEETLGFFGTAAPLSGFMISGSNGYDLNPDFGVGAMPRKSPYPGQSGEDWLLRVDVVTSFVVGGGVPVAQIHAIISDTSPTTSTANYVIVGSNMGPVRLAGAILTHGYVAAELVAGTHFFIRLNAWTNAMGGNILNLRPQNLRYLGLAIMVPNYHVAGTFFTNAGLLNGKIVKSSDIFSTPGNFAYPAGMAVKG